MMMIDSHYIQEACTTRAALNAPLTLIADAHVSPSRFIQEQATTEYVATINCSPTARTNDNNMTKTNKNKDGKGKGKVAHRHTSKPAKTKSKPSSGESPSVAVASIRIASNGEKLNDGQQKMLTVCEKLNLSPPRGKRLTHTKIINSIKTGLPQGYKSMSREAQRRCYFLYSRDLLPPGCNQKDQSKKLERLVYNNSSAEYKRLGRLTASSVPGDTLMLKPRRGLQLFKDQGSRQLRENWSPSAAEHNARTYVMTVNMGYGGLEGYERLQGLPEPIQRAQEQKSGTCFVQAPAVQVNYLLQKHTGSFEGQVDVCKVIRQSFNPQMFYNYVFGNHGDSVLTLNAILGGKGYDKIAVAAGSSDRCFRRLKEHGPGLVSRFAIYSDFRIAQKFSYDEIPNHQEPEGYHAMVLIAMRKDKNKHIWWFLLQNTWASKQFIEVTGEYLEFCTKGDITFVDGEITKLPDSFRKCKQHYAEAHLEGGNDTIFRFFEGPNDGC